MLAYAEYDNFCILPWVAFGWHGLSGACYISLLDTLNSWLIFRWNYHYITTNQISIGVQVLKATSLWSHIDFRFEGDTSVFKKFILSHF